MIRALALALVAALAAAPAQAGGFGDGGRAIYERHCVGCHGADGRPDLPGTPDFSRGDSLLKSDHELIASIRYGLRAMPGFDLAIDREGLIDVVAYIRSLQR